VREGNGAALARAFAPAAEQTDANTPARVLEFLGRAASAG
jgi:hypothetical protein